jgi:hypothetical protein
VPCSNTDFKQLVSELAPSPGGEVKDALPRFDVSGVGFTQFLQVLCTVLRLVSIQ